MSNYYELPGISVSEVETPILAPSGIAPTVVAVVGDSNREQGFSEIVTLSETTAVALSKNGVRENSVIVQDQYTGVIYSGTTDYDVAIVSNGTTTVRDDSATVIINAVSNIPDGTSVIVSYKYTDTEYFVPTMFTSFDSVREAYGAHLTDSGAVGSPLSLAAYFAFYNGAQFVKCVPLDTPLGSPVLTDWQAAIDKLRSAVDVDAVCVASSDPAVVDYLASHVNNVALLGTRQRAFVGVNGLATTPTLSSLRTRAAAFSSPRVSLVAPGRIEMSAGFGTTPVRLPGEYIAAAVAGRFASQTPQTPITRKQVYGFSKLIDVWTKAEQQQLGEGGVCLVVQNRAGELIINHGLTTSSQSIYSREINIQASKDALMEAILGNLDSQGIIGSILDAEMPNTVLGSVEGVLEEAVETQLIAEYSGLQQRVPTTNPTTVQIRFAYRPSMPLNNIIVELGIDTTSGSVKFSDTATDNAEVI